MRSTKDIIHGNGCLWRGRRGHGNGDTPIVPVALGKVVVHKGSERHCFITCSEQHCAVVVSAGGVAALLRVLQQGLMPQSL